jgi:hypothetical protein
MRGIAVASGDASETDVDKILTAINHRGPELCSVRQGKYCRS